jgi:hypothetical protein
VSIGANDELVSVEIKKFPSPILIEPIPSVSIRANDELVSEKIETVTSSEEMSQREQASLQIAHAYYDGLGIRPVNVVLQRSFERDACLWSTSCYKVSLKRVIGSKADSVHRNRIPSPSGSVTSIRGHHLAEQGSWYQCRNLCSALAGVLSELPLVSAREEEASEQLRHGR